MIDQSKRSFLSMMRNAALTPLVSVLPFKQWFPEQVVDPMKQAFCYVYGALPPSTYIGTFFFEIKGYKKDDSEFMDVGSTIAQGSRKIDLGEYCSEKEIDGKCYYVIDIEGTDNTQDQE